MKAEPLEQQIVALVERKAVPSCWLAHWTGLRLVDEMVPSMDPIREEQSVVVTALLLGQRLGSQSGQRMVRQRVRTKVHLTMQMLVGVMSLVISLNYS